jgi:hypothetical protein
LSVPQLAEELRAESTKGVAPFNSPAFKEIVTRGAAAGGELAPLVVAKGPESFLGLLALRQLDQSKYKALAPDLRAAILVESLRTAKSFNAFGLPGTTAEAAAAAIVEDGQTAVERLTALLRDKRPAPVWGSEIYMVYKLHEYRVCDYAFAFISAIQKTPTDLPLSPIERDRLIEPLLAPP